MNLLESKTSSFPKAEKEEWERKASESLKGKPVEKLKTVTMEGITLQPVYSGETREAIREYPGEAPYTRGIHKDGYNGMPWQISQQIEGNTAEELLRNFELAADRGQNTLSVSSSVLASLEPKDVQAIFQYSASKGIPLFIDAKGGQKALACQLKKMAVDGPLEGVMAEDPITEGVMRGKGIKDKNGFFEAWAGAVMSAHEAAPGLRTVLVKSHAYHNAGANAAEELGIALALGAEYLHQASEAGYNAEVIADKMVFSFGIDSGFFMNIAKLRAARRLWSLMGKEYGGSEESFKMYIHSETSAFTATLFDPYVNLLRTGNQAFAAVAGGSQSITVLPFDCAANKPSAFSERIARNIQLILKEETLLDKVVDPAGGSYYIEALTDELAEKAWSFFLEIEEQGGILEALQAGWLQAKVQETCSKKRNLSQHGAIRLIGTNVYANLEDEIAVHPSAEVDIALPFETEEIAPLEKRRLAEDFEKLRMASLRYKEKQGELPRVGLICLGNLKTYKPKADFIKGFLAAGGIEGIERPCTTQAEAEQFMKETHFQHYVVCGSDEDYHNDLAVWLESYDENSAKATIYMAGKQKGRDEELFLSLGVKDFISVSSNSITILTAILKDLEVM